MKQFVDRLIDCGWTEDNAWLVVEDLISELGVSDLSDFVRREEYKCG